MAKAWDDDEIKLLTELYPTHTLLELCDILHRSEGSVRGMKTKLGLNTKYKRIDLVGEIFGNLRVLERAPCTSGSSTTRYRCHCTKCGRDDIVVGSWWLRHSDPESHCPCTKRKGIRSSSYKHGGCGTKLYSIWCAMHNRTTNPKQWNYQYYGARGISICDDWKDFSAFQKWATETGYKDGLSIDRIDTNGNYEPGNCRWIPLNEQQATRRPFDPHKCQRGDTYMKD